MSIENPNSNNSQESVAIKNNLQPEIFKMSFAEVSDSEWYKASDLLESINNYLLSVNKEKMTADEVADTFNFITPSEEEEWLGSGPNAETIPLPYYVVNQEEELILHDPMFVEKNENSWLSTMIDQKYFLPKKLGDKILKAVKQPILSKIRRIL